MHQNNEQGNSCAVNPQVTQGTGDGDGPLTGGEPDSYLDESVEPRLAWEPAPGLRVLVVEDIGVLRETCVEITRGFGFLAEAVATLDDARSILKSRQVDLLLLDIYVGEAYSLALVDEFRLLQPDLLIIAMTSYMSAATTTDLLQRSVDAYLEKPFTIAHLKSTLDRAALRPSFHRDLNLVRQAFESEGSQYVITSRSPNMQKVAQMVNRVAPTNHPVLVFGEPGTGKEYVARCIHAKGHRSQQPFLTVHCTALGTTNSNSQAEFRECLSWLDQPCTVYFDEISWLSLAQQDELLSHMDRGSVIANPESRAKIIAGTTRDLGSMVESCLFRRRLNQRLNLTKISVPDLNKRREDIPLLVSAILETLRLEFGYECELSGDAMSFLVRHHWARNVRELSDRVKSAYLSCSGRHLHYGDLVDQSQHLQTPLPSEPRPNFQHVQANVLCPIVPLAEIEKQTLLEAVQKLNGDRLLAARMLGIGKTTLYRKLKEYECSADNTEDGHDGGYSSAA